MINNIFKFITGNQAVVKAAQSVEASFMSGYPITPATEILEEWAKLHGVNPHKYRFIQAEDEIAAGFNTLGGLLAGARAFTATAGPGHILMQDSMAMAEAMRLPMVLIVMQRGGPSTGTVIYGQQEVTLACFGGNGEGLRIVYSVSNPQEIYDYTQKAFFVAWQYRFPVIVLGDGYSAKMKEKIKLRSNKYKIKSEIILGEKQNKNLRNCYNIESQLAKVLNNDISDFKQISSKVVESETFNTNQAEIIIVAHGIVAQAAKEACKILSKSKRVGLFRPITLNPFDFATLSRISAKAKKIIVIESSHDHLLRIVKSGLFNAIKVETLQKPVEAISVEEIVKSVK